VLSIDDDSFHETFADRAYLRMRKCKKFTYCEFLLVF